MSSRYVNRVLGALALSTALAVHAGMDPAQQSLRAGVLFLWSESPQVQAAEASIAARRAGLRGAAKPLYNPELDLEYRTAAETEASVGVRQAVDWGGKRDAHFALAGNDVDFALAELRRVKLALAMSWLRAAARHSFASSRQALAERKIALTNRFREVAKRRVTGGDLRQSDANLAQLAAVDAIAELARVTTELSDARAQIAALVGTHRLELPTVAGVPDTGSLLRTDRAAWLPRLPGLAVLDAGVQRARAAVTLADRERRSDPTIGLRGGRDGDDALFGVTLEVPMAIRNHFDENVEVARARVLELEQRLQNERRRTLAMAGAALQRYQTMSDAWDRWRSLSAQVLVEQEGLLATLWDTGAINAPDYLLQLEQVLNARLQGMAIREGLWSAWFDWLEATGQAVAWLDLKEDGA